MYTSHRGRAGTTQKGDISWIDEWILKLIAEAKVLKGQVLNFKVQNLGLKYQNPKS